MSSRPLAQEQIAGAPWIWPPSDSHPRQAVPSHQRCQTAESSPRATTSMRFGPHETALGFDVIVPPRPSQPCQPTTVGSTTPLAVQNGNSVSIPAWPYAILKKPPSPQDVPHEFLQIQHPSASE